MCVPTEIKFALTDINSASGCLYHAMQFQNAGLPVIMGIDFRTGNRQDRKSTRLNSSHSQQSRMPSSA